MEITEQTDVVEETLDLIPDPETGLVPTSDAEARLIEVERRIEQHAVGMRQALREIREERLYVVAGFHTFDEYCATRWNMTRRHVDRLISWDEVAENVRDDNTPEPERERHARELADLKPEIQREVWQETVATAPETGITTDHVRQTRERMLGKPSPAEVEEKRRSDARSALTSSDSVEWFTPRHVLDLARELLINIDTDPASCAEANEVVQAGTIYTVEDNGLHHPWLGKVWLNPPYGRDANNRSNQQVWSHRWLTEFAASNMAEGLLLVNAATGAQWFQPLWSVPLCFVRGRISFDEPSDADGDRDQPTHYSVIAYHGPNVAEFDRLFSTIGNVVIPRGYDCKTFRVTADEEE